MVFGLHRRVRALLRCSGMSFRIIRRRMFVSRDSRLEVILLLVVLFAFGAVYVVVSHFVGCPTAEFFVGCFCFWCFVGFANFVELVEYFTEGFFALDGDGLIGYVEGDAAAGSD